MNHFCLPKASAHDSVSERLRRWTRNPLGSARRGSNPLAVDFTSTPFGVRMQWCHLRAECNAVAPAASLQQFSSRHSSLSLSPSPVASLPLLCAFRSCACFLSRRFLIVCVLSCVLRLTKTCRTNTSTGRSPPSNIDHTRSRAWVVAATTRHPNH